MRYYLLIAAALFITRNAHAQQALDGSFAFESEPLKKFSIYIPVSYDMATPNKLMLAFHPFNTTAQQWRDKLITFGETNNLILLCPDGGTDGKVDDPLDYRFTTAVLDSMRKWYNIDEKGIFAMGFSIGGKAMYEYGLENAKVFSGFIPVGPAINGTTEVSSLLKNAICKPFYLVHGENDSPSTRYNPIKQALIDNKAEVNFILMAGVGHTFDFPNRNTILNMAFEWIDTVTCKTSTGISVVKRQPPFTLFPSIVSRDEALYLGIHLRSPKVLTIDIRNIEGRLVHHETDSFDDSEHKLPVNKLSPGIYVIKVAYDEGSFTQKFIVK